MGLYDGREEQRLEERAAAKFATYPLREIVQLKQGEINALAKVCQQVLKGMTEVSLLLVKKEYVPKVLERVRQMNKSSKLRKLADDDERNFAEQVAILMERYVSIYKVVRDQYYSERFAAAVTLYVIKRDLYKVVAPVLREEAPALLEAENNERFNLLVDRIADRIGTVYAEKVGLGFDEEALRKIG